MKFGKSIFLARISTDEENNQIGGKKKKISLRLYSQLDRTKVVQPSTFTFFCPSIAKFFPPFIIFFFLLSLFS